jgi:hypothetical protein
MAKRRRVANGDWRMVKQKFSGGQRFCDGEKFFGASGDAPFGFSACFSLASFS